jgi:tRNA threonylcarbamoyladenosine biosynthesis protein TsaB
VNLLALETTEPVGTVAAMADGKLLAQLELDRSQRSAQSLIPAMGQLLDRVGWKTGDVQLTAVSIGPGSFTGLRVGATAAKLFAYAVGSEILGINTLEAIAAAAPPEVLHLSVVIDAQRGQLAERQFTRGPDGWFAPVADQRLVDIETWLEELPPGIAVAGPVLAKLTNYSWASYVRLLDRVHWPPRAEAVARLAARDFAAGRRDDCWRLVPHYCRRSAAEEKAARSDGL